MIKQIGAKVYYCNITGNVIKIVYDMQGFVVETTVDEDYEIYTELNERDKSTVGLLQFEFGEYLKLCANSTGVRIDLETLKPIFTYDELPLPPVEPTWEETVNTKISTLETENQALKQELTITQDAVNELILNSMSL